MFWKRKEVKEGEVDLPAPKAIPHQVGSYMVVNEKKNPDWVWNLKGAVRPMGKKTYYCRVFDQSKTGKAGIKVKDWNSLDGHPDLIVWEGYIDEETHTVRPEKFPGSSGTSK